jgi:hypothetical protein
MIPAPSLAHVLPSSSLSSSLSLSEGLAGAIDRAVPREPLRMLPVEVAVKHLEQTLEQAALW